MPFRLSKTNNKVRQYAVVICTMPMCCTWLSPDDITSSQTLWHSTFIANPSVSCDYSNELTFFVRVPMCAGTGRECDICDGCVGVEMNGIKEYIAGESFSRFDAFCGLVVTASNDDGLWHSGR